MNDPRASQADALMGEIQRGRAGRLTVFLGAAPGVGKTYTMLSRARELKRRGMDVVVGIAETHGRPETAALVEGLDVLPRKRVPYRGRTLEELDLDTLLARRPQLALIDELAHRNVPGSRHERRWQDVDELLDAGIDVYTTVNVQHLESLNDVVHRITGVRVSETVPDAIFDRLRDIVLVDLPPRELIERLQQGKVYVPEQAAQALQAFFSPSNLGALRELAMQTAADRVDSELRESRDARGMEAVPLRRAVVVAVDGRGQSEYLVRVGRRLAERRGAPWSVVTVQTGRPPQGDALLELDRAFALARRLGGETAVLHGGNVVDALLDHVRRTGASGIVLGRTRERPLARAFNRTLTQQLLVHGKHFELTIVGVPDSKPAPPANRRLAWPLPGNEAALAVLTAAAATALGAIAERWVGLTDLSMIFIVAVVLLASRTRMIAAVIAASLCFLTYNFFFIEPRYTFYIGARQGVVTVVLFLGAALVAGRLASKLRAQVLALRTANGHATALEALGRQLASAADVGQVLRAGCHALSEAMHADAVIRLQQGEWQGATASSLTEKDRAAADWSMHHRQPAGRFTDTLSGTPWWFLPLDLGGDQAGVVGLRFAPGPDGLGAERQRLAEAMTADVAQALVRTRLVSDLENARVTGETERLRAALLSSVSHDLRSPLAVILGASSSLRHLGTALSDDDRNALLDTIHVEGERLDRYIQNLLDMTRLGHQGLTLTRDWIGPGELIASAVSRLKRYEPEARFALDVDPAVESIWVHPALIEQALFNVMENAVKFSPPGEAVTVQVREFDVGLCIDVIDRGPGIPEDERSRIFDMFYSVERGDRGRKGTGLGLAICQGMIGAHGGTVEALPGPEGRGTRIRIILPRATPEGSPQ